MTDLGRDKLCDGLERLVKMRFRDLLLRTGCCAVLWIMMFPGPECVAEDGIAILPAAPQEALAVYKQGIRFLKGDGIEKNEMKAFELIEKAASAGHPDAFDALAWFFAAGVAVLKDEEKARNLYEEGVKAGSARAHANLGRFLINGRGGAKEVGRGIGLLENARVHLPVEASLSLGEVFFFGEHQNSRPDFYRAYETIIGIAHAGNAKAQNMIGTMIQDGRIASHQPSEARGWYEKAAAQNDPKACFNLGQLIFSEAATSEERIEGLMWLLSGEKAGDLTSTRHLESIRGRIDPLEKTAAHHRMLERQGQQPRP